VVALQLPQLTYISCCSSRYRSYPSCMHACSCAHSFLHTRCACSATCWHSRSAVEPGLAAAFAAVVLQPHFSCTTTLPATSALYANCDSAVSLVGLLDQCFFTTYVYQYELLRSSNLMPISIKMV
jgi:hypothetical protein